MSGSEDSALQIWPQLTYPECRVLLFGQDEAIDTVGQIEDPKAGLNGFDGFIDILSHPSCLEKLLFLWTCVRFVALWQYSCVSAQKKGSSYLVAKRLTSSLYILVQLADTVLEADCPGPDLEELVDS